MRAGSEDVSVLECVEVIVGIPEDLGYRRYLCYPACDIQSKTEEGHSSKSTFYLPVCETAVLWLRRNGNPQVTDIRTVKELPEDLTLAGCVITSTCKALAAEERARYTCQPTSAWRKERQGFHPAQKSAGPSSLLSCHAQLHRARVCLSAGAESDGTVPGLTICTVFRMTCCPYLCAPRKAPVSITTDPIPLESPCCLRRPRADLAQPCAWPL